MSFRPYGPSSDTQAETITSGTVDPVAIEPDGSLYLKKDVAGQTIAIYERVAGAWVKTLGSPAFAQVMRSSVLSLANTTLTTIGFESVIEDEVGADALADLTASATVPLTIRRAGLYLVGAQAGFGINGAGYRLLQIRGAASQFVGILNVQGPPTLGASLSLARPYRFAVGDQIWLQVRQSSGAALDLTSASLSALFVRP